MVRHILDESNEETSTNEDTSNKVGQTIDDKPDDASRDIEENLPETAENVQGLPSIDYSL